MFTALKSGTALNATSCDTPTNAGVEQTHHFLFRLVLLGGKNYEILSFSVMRITLGQ